MGLFHFISRSARLIQYLDSITTPFTLWRDIYVYLLGSTFLRRAKCSKAKGTMSSLTHNCPLE